jgi:hypothetical protein
MFQAKLIRKASLMAAAAAGISLLAGAASAQMFEQPRSFKARDGAGLAVFMRSLQGTTTSATAGGDSTILVCGGSGGQSTATANSSCLILNNSDASALIGQESNGDQNADATSESTTTTTTADEVSNILNSQTTK